MLKSILLVAFVGIVAVNAVELTPQKDAWGFIVDNIIDPFVETVIDNTVNLITGAILGLFGKRDAWGFVVDNIIDPFVETVIDNTVNLITGAILGLFGKRDAWGFIVDNIIDPFVETVIDNTVNLITGAILGLFGKRDAWGFLVDNIIDPFVETVIDNTVNLITGAILGLFGKRGLDFTQLIVPIIQQFVPSLVQGITSAINHLITALLPLARQQIYHLPGHPVSIGIADALYEFSNELKVNSHLFLSSVVQVAQQILSTIQLNSLVNVLQHVVNQINSLVQFIAPIVNAVFALLANPVVSNLLGQIIG